MFPLLDVFIGATRVILEVPKREVNGLKSYPTFSPWHSFLSWELERRTLKRFRVILVFFCFLFLKDPCPHIPRCSHERTLSALQRQRLRFKTEEEVKNREVRG